MAQINLLISGNLTGFSRLYTSPDANSIYNEAKFDFDYRNLLTFLQGNEKAYAIAFSTDVIAISLVTRILDSFHRPGLLAVSILLHRNEVVVPIADLNDTTSIYRLLNQINDKFYEKNFLNGLMNQNAAVLMQDYYTEFLQNYTVVRCQQSSVNRTIDSTTAIRKAGYVVPASESDIPFYLATPCRSSYSGYHLIFISTGATTDIIPEPAVEQKRYTVTIANTGRMVNSVLLSDKIPNTIQPKEWEESCKVDYTYEQVLNGQASPDIVAIDEGGERLTLTYRFKPKTKTIRFKFKIKGEDVDWTKIEPMFVFNGQRRTFRSDLCTFEGEETVSRLVLECGSSAFIINSNYSTIDMRRHADQDEITVLVSACFSVHINFADDSRKPKNIRFSNSLQGIQENAYQVTDSISQRLSGAPEDWRIEITSDYYVSYSCALSTIKSSIHLETKRNTFPVPEPPKPVNPRQEPGHGKRKKEGWVWQQWAALSLGVIIVGVCIMLMIGGFNVFSSWSAPSEKVETPVKKEFVFSFSDQKGKFLSKEIFDQMLKDDVVHVRLEADSAYEAGELNAFDDEYFARKADICALPSCTGKINIQFSVDGIAINTELKQNDCIFSWLNAKVNEKNNVTVYLSGISVDEIQTYYDIKRIKNSIDSDRLSALSDSIVNFKNTELKDKAQEKLGSLKSSGNPSTQNNTPTQTTLDFNPENGNWKTYTIEQLENGECKKNNKPLRNALIQALQNIKRYADKGTTFKKTDVKGLGENSKKAYEDICTLELKCSSDSVEVEALRKSLKEGCKDGYSFNNVENAIKKYLEKHETN